MTLEQIEQKCDDILYKVRMGLITGPEAIECLKEILRGL
jgi:hypothetical protein